VIVGPGESTVGEAGRAGSLASYGLDVTVALPGETTATTNLPLSVTVGAWLLQRDGWEGPVHTATVGDGDGVELGRQVAARADRVALLVMADGSPLRADTTPQDLRARAESYDAALAEALRGGEAEKLLGLDAELAAETGAEAGRQALTVLAGAAGEQLYDAEVGYEAAPFGVGYLVGVWERHG
ncbi:hypothetical protein, partial [Jiangella anatolica]